MNHKEVLAKRLGGRIRETVQLGYQCTARAKGYAKERGREQIGYFGGVGAYQWWVNDNNTFNPKFYDKIPNTISAVPDQWDIIIFKADKTNGYHWHIWIVDSATKTYVRVCEQNGGQWKWEWIWTDAIRIRKYSYTNVVGWYHYKQWIITSSTPEDKDTSTIENTEFSIANQFLVDNKIYNGEWIIDNTRLVIILARILHKIKW